MGKLYEFDNRLYRNLDVYVSREASLKELDRFHDKEYIEYLS